MFLAIDTESPVASLRRRRAEPSRADELITQRVKEALALVDIRLLDHIIVGDGVSVSLAERGLRGASSGTHSADQLRVALRKFVPIQAVTPESGPYSTYY